MKLAKIIEMALLIVFGMLLMGFAQANRNRQLAQTPQAPLSCPTLPVSTPEVVYLVVTATPENAMQSSAATATRQPTPTPLDITIGPLVTFTPLPTNTPQPTATQAVQVAPPTAAPSATSATSGATPVSPPLQAQVANDAVNVRVLPGRNAERLTQLARGAIVTIIQRQNVDGEIWARVLYSGVDGWILESLLTTPGSAAIAPRPTFTSAPAAGSGSAGGSGAAPGFTCPRNCEGARAMGLTAEQAATCPGLDRDHDGVACYGD